MRVDVEWKIIVEHERETLKESTSKEHFRGKFQFLTIQVHVVVDDDASRCLANKHRRYEDIGVVRGRHNLQLIGVLVVYDDSIEACILRVTDLVWKVRMKVEKHCDENFSQNFTCKRA